ncbi:MAG: isoprenylcysteine carboxylmethyltransferase family protein [Syntrophaceae bacterium]|nr:isoprenylcysteine carboxylmethyltransferase family protein [Syntrophaceae bacterium]
MQKFIEGVVNCIYRITTGTKRVRLLLTPLFALVFFCVVIFLIVVSLSLDRFLELPEFAPKPFRIILSLPLIIGGAFLWLWCVGKFFKTRGTPAPVNPPPKLVTDGPYAYSRNPMMTGLFMFMAGIGIFFGSITLTFFMTPFFVLMSILEFKYIEEPELEKRFGKVYTEYKEKIPIIIPGSHRK